MCVLPKGGSLVGRLLAAAANIFLSLLLGAIALAFLAVQFPDIIQTLLNSAGWLRDQVTGTGLDPKYNIWLTFLIDERQLVFLGFVIVMRILLALIIGGVAGMLGMGRRY